MKKIVAICLLFACVTPLKAEAFSFKNIFKRNTTPAAVTPSHVSAANMVSTLSDMQSQAYAVDKQVQNSLLQIASQLSGSTHETETLNSKMNSLIANSYRTNVEQYNEMSKLMTEYTNALKNDKATVSNAINNMTDAQKAALVNNVITLVKSSNEYVSIAKVGAQKASEIMKMSNKASEIVSNLNTINTMASEITNRARTTLTLANQLRTVAKAAGVSTF